MVPSLTHLSMLAIPMDTVFTDTETVVLTNIKWDATSKFNKAMDVGRELSTQMTKSKNKYYNALAHGGPGGMTDTEDMCEELYIIYDAAVEMRNTMASHGLWSDKFVYMDWLISKILCCPRRGEEAEELYHMLRGCTDTWNRIKPSFTIESYTHTELELYGLIINFKNCCFRNFKTMDDGAVKGIDEIMEISRPLIAMSNQVDENDKEKMFLKKITTALNHHVPYYYTLTPAEISPPKYYDFSAAEAIVLDSDLEDDETAGQVWGLLDDDEELEEGEIMLDDEEMMQLMWNHQ